MVSADGRCLLRLWKNAKEQPFALIWTETPEGFCHCNGDVEVKHNVSPLHPTITYCHCFHFSRWKDTTWLYPCPPKNKQRWAEPVCGCLFCFACFSEKQSFLLCCSKIQQTDEEGQNFDVKQAAFTISSFHFDRIGVSLEAQTGDTHAVCYSLPQLLQVAGRFFLPSVLQFEISSFSYERQVSSRSGLLRRTRGWWTGSDDITPLQTGYLQYFNVPSWDILTSYR